MEKTLHEREEQFRALLQNSSDAHFHYWTVMVRSFSKSSEKDKILDFEMEELLYKSFFDIVHPMMFFR